MWYKKTISALLEYFRDVSKNQKQVDCNAHAERRPTLSLANDNSNLKSDCLESGESKRDQIQIDFSFASDRKEHQLVKDIHPNSPDKVKNVKLKQSDFKV